MHQRRKLPRAPRRPHNRPQPNRHRRHARPSQRRLLRQRPLAACSLGSSAYLAVIPPPRHLLQRHRLPNAANPSAKKAHSADHAKTTAPASDPLKPATATDNATVAAAAADVEHAIPVARPTAKEWTQPTTHHKPSAKTAAQATAHHGNVASAVPGASAAAAARATGPALMQAKTPVWPAATRKMQAAKANVQKARNAPAHAMTTAANAGAMDAASAVARAARTAT